MTQWNDNELAKTASEATDDANAEQAETSTGTENTSADADAGESTDEAEDSGTPV